MVPKDLRFEHECAKLASRPGRYLTSLRPCRGEQTFSMEGHIENFILPGTAYITYIQGFLRRFWDPLELNIGSVESEKIIIGT